jgi:hypothetical protein
VENTERQQDGKQDNPQKTYKQKNSRSPFCARPPSSPANPQRTPGRNDTQRRAVWAGRTGASRYETQRQIRQHLCMAHHHGENPVCDPGNGLVRIGEGEKCVCACMKGCGSRVWVQWVGGESAGQEIFRRGGVGVWCWLGVSVGSGYFSDFCGVGRVSVLTKLT